MTAQHPDILTVRDAEILRLLHRVIEIGEYRRQFTAEDVAHTVNRWLIPREAEIRHLKPVPTPRAPKAPVVVNVEPGAPTVALSKNQYLVVTELLSGHSNQVIAEAMNITTETVKSHLQRAYRVLGVHSRGEAIAVIRGGKVRITQKPNGNRGKRK